MSKWIDVKVAVPAMTRTAVVCDDGEKWIGYYSISKWFRAEIIHSYKCLRWRPLTAAEIIAGKVLPDEPDASKNDPIAQFGNYTVRHSSDGKRYMVFENDLNNVAYFLDFTSACDAAKEYDYSGLCAAREKEKK